MERTLDILTENAFKFTEERGKVTLILELLDDSEVVVSADKMSAENTKYVRIVVRDTGIGIKPEQLPHVFDRFYQAESSSTTKYEGTGIGLALAKL